MFLAIGCPQQPPVRAVRVLDSGMAAQRSRLLVDLGVRVGQDRGGVPGGRVRRTGRLVVRRVERGGSRRHRGRDRARLHLVGPLVSGPGLRVRELGLLCGEQAGGVGRSRLGPGLVVALERLSGGERDLLVGLGQNGLWAAFHWASWNCWTSPSRTGSAGRFEIPLGGGGDPPRRARPRGRRCAARSWRRNSRTAGATPVSRASPPPSPSPSSPPGAGWRASGFPRQPPGRGRSRSHSARSTTSWLAHIQVGQRSNACSTSRRRRPARVALDVAVDAIAVGPVALDGDEGEALLGDQPLAEASAPAVILRASRARLRPGGHSGRRRWGRGAGPGRQMHPGGARAIRSTARASPSPRARPSNRLNRAISVTSESLPRGKRGAFFLPPPLPSRERGWG